MCVAWLGYHQNGCKILTLTPLLPARYPPTLVAQCLLHNDCMVSMPLSDENTQLSVEWLVAGRLHTGAVDHLEHKPGAAHVKRGRRRS